MPEPDQADRAVLTGREWRRRWEALEERRREHIRDSVRAGRGVRDLEGARLGLTLARRLRREVTIVTLLLPPAAAAALAFGFGFSSTLLRGGEFHTTVGSNLVRVFGWPSGVVVLGAVVVLFAATVPFRRRLRDAEEDCRDAIEEADRRSESVVDHWSEPHPDLPPSQPENGPPR